VARVVSLLKRELGCGIARFKMGLDATLFWLEQNEKIVNENLLNDRIIRTWRKNYALNHWIFKLVKKKTGFVDKQKILDYMNENLIELTRDELTQLKNDIICGRVRVGDDVFKRHGFVDIALGKAKREKIIFYEMSW
jgi:hypothetical protein